MRELKYSIISALLCNCLWRCGPPRAPECFESVPTMLQMLSNSGPKVFNNGQQVIQQCSNNDQQVVQHWYNN
eukprot:9606542-Heterocapsa_arctica.AAC.1